MGIPSRAPGTPYIDGQTLGADRLEPDIANLFAEIARIQNVNVASDANIAGSKLADASIPTAKYQGNSVTRATLALKAVMSQASGYTPGSLALTTSFQDAVTASALLSQTPVGLVVIFFQCVVTLPNGAGGAVSVKVLRGATEIATRTLTGNPSTTTGVAIRSSCFFLDTAAAASSSLVYKAQIRNTVAAQGSVIEREIFAIELAQ